MFWEIRDSFPLNIFFLCCPRTYVLAYSGWFNKHHWTLIVRQYLSFGLCLDIGPWGFAIIFLLPAVFLWPGSLNCALVWLAARTLWAKAIGITMVNSY